MEEVIRKAISEVLTKVGAPGATFVVERPLEAAHGDYATNAALAVAKTVGRNPRELGDELARLLMESLDSNLVSHVSVAGPGFVNITLAREAIRARVSEAIAKGDAWGGGIRREGEKVMVEYTDPNPFKEMHIGHLMSNVIGESISRLIANEGAEVFRACYSGDVGPHVAKAIWGLMQERKKKGEKALLNFTAFALGSGYARGSKAYEEDESAKKEIDEINVQIYTKSANTEVQLLYDHGRTISLEHFEELYKILGTHFDKDFFESQSAPIGLDKVRAHIADGVFEESEGAVIYRGEKKGLHTLVFITSRGTPTYETKDIGLAFLKEEEVPGLNHSIIVTAAEQIGHFKVMLAALSEIAPEIAAKTEHVPHGFLRLTTGKMSSREGTVISAAGFIEEVKERASERSEDPAIAEQIAIGAIKYMVLRQSPGSDIIFDPEKSLSLEGDSGPYLQYALVRAKKILAYADNGQSGVEEPDEPYAIERLIVHYPEVVARAATEFAPNILTTYLTELASAWNALYASEQILGSAEEAYKQRVARAFAQTMTNGLALLGISAPEKM